MLQTMATLARPDKADLVWHVRFIRARECLLPNFRATVGTSNGERLVVEQEAPSAQALAEEFAARGMYVIDVSEVKTSGRAFWRRLTDTFNQSDLLDFTRSLRTLIKAGLPVYQALELINEDEDSPFRLRLIGGVLHDLAHGLALSEALGKRPTCFPIWYVRTVQASEATGTMEETLGDLARVIKRSQRVRSKIFSAAIYPAVLLFLIFVVIFVMLGFVLPRMEVFFTGMGVELPWDTQMLLALSRWMTGHIPALLGIHLCRLLWTVGAFIPSQASERHSIAGNIARQFLETLPEWQIFPSSAERSLHW